jgi:hypothetical protein
MTDHVYLSTGCLHGEHDYCRGMVLFGGVKRPAQCKFCEAPCICECHLDVVAHAPDGQVRIEREP